MPYAMPSPPLSVSGPVSVHELGHIKWMDLNAVASTSGTKLGDDAHREDEEECGYQLTSSVSCPASIQVPTATRSPPRSPLALSLALAPTPSAQSPNVLQFAQSPRLGQWSQQSWTHADTLSLTPARTASTPSSFPQSNIKVDYDYSHSYSHTHSRPWSPSLSSSTSTSAHSHSHVYDANSNDAGAPLPRIPRRIVSSASTDSTASSSSWVFESSPSPSPGSSPTCESEIRGRAGHEEANGDGKEETEGEERGRGRVGGRTTKFVVGNGSEESEEGSGSGSGIGDGDGDGDAQPEREMEADELRERAKRRREVTLEVETETELKSRYEEDGSDEEDPTTPTPRSLSSTPVPMLTQHSPSPLPSASARATPLDSNMPGIAPRARRHRGRSGFDLAKVGMWLSAYEAEGEGAEVTTQDGTSVSDGDVRGRDEVESNDAAVDKENDDEHFFKHGSSIVCPPSKSSSESTSHPAATNLSEKGERDAVTLALKSAFGKAEEDGAGEVVFTTQTTSRTPDGSGEEGAEGEERGKVVTTTTTTTTNTRRVPMVTSVVKTTTSSPVLTVDTQLANRSGVTDKRGYVPGAGHLRLDLSPTTMSTIVLTSPPKTPPKTQHVLPPLSAGAAPCSATRLAVPSHGVTSPVLGITRSASMCETPLIRKKSGEILKSSLKKRSASASTSTRRPLSGGLSLPGIFGLGLNVPPSYGSPSISAPATPTATSASEAAQRERELNIAEQTVKNVHFDAQLEHVKLFLAEQKPAAVSRDGSPTLDDTTGESSGGEGGSFGAMGAMGAMIMNGSPSFYPDSDEEAKVKKSLTMRVLNVHDASPVVVSAGEEVALGISFGSATSDVQLECLRLAEDATSVVGNVRVKNIAFEKRVVVRFTFDNWQTTSEVAAKWIESCGGLAANFGPGFDRFSFSIRLSDLLLRIEEKTLVLAIRYSAAGNEIWDNNVGQNYKIAFEKRVPMQIQISTASCADSRQLLSSEQRDDVKDGHDHEGVTDNGNGEVSSGSGTSTTQKKHHSLASRYDLAASLKSRNTWRPSLEHAMTWAGRDTARASFGRSSVPWPHKRSNGDNAGQAQSPAHVHGHNHTRGHGRGNAPDDHGTSAAAHRLCRGSPRDQELDPEGSFGSVYSFPKHHDGSNADVGPFDVSGFPHSSGSRHHQHLPHLHSVRNHHRSYFDAWAANYAPGHSIKYGSMRARITPPTAPNAHASHVLHRTLSDPDASSHNSPAPTPMETPVSDRQPASSPGRYNSFPPLGSASVPAALRPDSPRVMIPPPTDSEASTPSITSVSSPTGTLTPSPMSPPDFPEMHQLEPTETESVDSSTLDASSYNVFLDKFCFYTGRDSLHIPMDNIRRSYSASSVEDFLSSPSPSSVGSLLSGGDGSLGTPRVMTPTLSPLFDDNPSGFSTRASPRQSGLARSSLH